MNIAAVKMLAPLYEAWSYSVNSCEPYIPATMPAAPGSWDSYAAACRAVGLDPFMVRDSIRAMNAAPLDRIDEATLDAFCTWHDEADKHEAMGFRHIMQSDEWHRQQWATLDAAEAFEHAAQRLGLDPFYVRINLTNHLIG